MDPWNRLGGPANLPAPIVELVTAALRNPAMQARYDEFRMVSPPKTTPAYAASYIREQIAQWQPVVREPGMRVD